MTPSGESQRPARARASRLPSQAPQVLAALFRGHNPEPPPAAEDENQDRCGYCGGAGCAQCQDAPAMSAGGA